MNRAAATLMLRAGVDAHRVPRILRHSDVRTTTGIHGHLLVEDLRSAINAIAPKAVLPEPPNEQSHGLQVGAKSGPFVPSFSQSPRKRAHSRSSAQRLSSQNDTLRKRAMRESNPRPLAPECCQSLSTELSKLSQTVGTADSNSGIGKGADSNGSKPSQPVSAKTSSFVPSLSQAALRVVTALLTAEGAARILHVSTATVYRLCTQGGLPHIRVSNAIRIAPADLAAFIARRCQLHFARRARRRNLLAIEHGNRTLFRQLG